METDFIKHNPLLKKPALLVLALAETCTDRMSLEEAAMEAWASEFPQKPASVIDILVRAQALEEQLLVNGETYEGTLEDMQLDESVPDDAALESHIAITDAGRALASAYDPTHLIADLLASRPRYAPVYRAVAARCATAQGASREDVEAAVESLPEIVVNSEGAKVYPQYFIDALETAGAIEWDGAWHITAAGREQLTA